MTSQAGDPPVAAVEAPAQGYTEAELDRLFGPDPDRISVPPFTPVPKPIRVSDPAWLDEVRAMPCCVCVKLGLRQLTRTEPNHTETKGSGGGDDSAAPMCHAHHQLWHQLGRETFAAGTGIDPRAVAAELWHWHETRAF